MLTNKTKLLLISIIFLGIQSIWASEATRLAIPPTIDLSQYVDNISVDEFQLWGWAKNGMVAYSLGERFIVQDLVTDKIVRTFKADVNVTKGFIDIQRELQYYKIQSSQEPPQFLPFPQAINNVEYVVAIENINYYPYEGIKNVMGYDITASMGSKSKVISPVRLERRSGVLAVHVLGFLQSPFEDRLLVATASETSDGTVLSFYGCHLKVGFEEKVALDDAMIFVEGGTFIMGSDADHDVLEYSRPAHEVTVDSFYISKYEITQKEWFAIMNSNSSEIQGDNFPVNNISWYEAVVYCNKRSLAEGLTPVYSGQGGDTRADWSANGYRLPTEAEWEYAAQGGNKSQHYTYSGSNKLDEVAWHDHWIGSGFTDMHPVGMLKANELGLYDMSGNVWEWVWDWYDYYSASAQQNPTGPMGPASGQRVIKGGSHMDGDHYDYPTQHSPFYHRGRNPSAKRSGDNSWSDPSGIGFRVVRKH